MLVLSRKRDEKIVIPELGITITVLQLRGDRVRIGVDAPRKLNIVRGELMEAMASERQPELV